MIIKDQNKFLVENAGLKNENDSLRVDLTILEYEKEQLERTLYDCKIPKKKDRSNYLIVNVIYLL
jgi:hypothetical protein